MSGWFGFVLHHRMLPVFADSSEIARWISPLSGARLHYPIGLLALAVLLEAWAIRRPGIRLRSAIGSILGAAAAVACIVAGLGLSRVPGGELQSVQLQQFFAVALAALCSFAWWLHRQIFPRGGRIAGTVGRRSLVAMTLGVSVLAGFEGGEGGRAGGNGVHPGSLGFASLMASGDRVGPMPAAPLGLAELAAERVCWQGRSAIPRGHGLIRGKFDPVVAFGDAPGNSSCPANW